MKVRCKNWYLKDESLLSYLSIYSRTLVIRTTQGIKKSRKLKFYPSDIGLCFVRCFPPNVMEICYKQSDLYTPYCLCLKTTALMVVVCSDFEGVKTNGLDGCVVGLKFWLDP